MIRFAAVSAAVAVALLSASAASAADYRVVFGDLNLASSEGVSRLDRRIDRVARTACLTGSLIARSQCRVAFRDEALGLLPDSRRQDYVRARDSLDQARAVNAPA